MAGLIPPGKQTYFDQNGVPLAGGNVATYISGTRNSKPTYQDPGLTELNINPTPIGDDGTVVMWGSGSYETVVTDVNGNQVWDVYTGASLPDSAVSEAMLPVIGAPTLPQAISLLGIGPYVQNIVNGIQQTTGPTGPAGAQGIQGPTGPQGSTGGSTNYNIQSFPSAGNYTWTNPGGNFTWVYMWGAGGGGSGSATGGGGGPGSYYIIQFLTASLPAQVSGFIGAGGAYTGAIGGQGQTTNFGPYVSIAGGFGGTSDGTSAMVGAPGYLSNLTGFPYMPPICAFNASIAGDPYGNNFASYIGNSPGWSYADTRGTVQTFWGGAGGTSGVDGQVAGGGGGYLGGAGGSGQIIVVTQ